MMQFYHYVTNIYLDKNIEEETEVKPIKKKVSKNSTVKTSKPKCPQCGEELFFEGGCNICKSCGWTKCD